MKASGYVCAVALLSVGVCAHAATADEGWRFIVAPYIWGAGINGEAGANGVTSDVDISFSDIVDNLDFAFMGQFEARKGKFGFVVSPVYMDLQSKDKGPAGLLAAKVDLQSTIVDSFATWAVTPEIDLLFGARFTQLDAKLKLSTPLTTVSGSASRNWTDAIMGFRFDHRLNDRWSISGRADIGGGPAGESDLTWNANAQIGYSFSAGAMAFAGYRYLDYDYKDGDGSSRFTFNAHVYGPTIGFAWMF